MHNRRFRQLVILVTSFICLFYLVYRGFFTLNLGGPYAVFASLFLYVSECYGVVVMLLFFLQVWDVSHPPQQPVLEGHTVDVFVPTYNEDVDLLRTTLRACVAMDYPHRTYLCDDGGTDARVNDPEKGPASRARAAALKALCAELGVIYITRPENRHAKAGNCNHAFEKTDGEFIIIFDADHVPEKHFITRLIGYFADEKLAFVQTPHAFYNFHSFQSCYDHNTRSYWEDGQLFYEVIQPGRNRWNAPIFAGSAAMFRREALADVGYIATETITEDMHTGLRMHSRGWKSLGIPERMVAGQAAPDVTTFHTQRLRWGEGNLSIMAHNNPLTTPGLSLGQRLCYLGSMIHWSGGLFKVAIYLTPLLMLVTGVAPVEQFTWFLFLLTAVYVAACVGSFKVISNGHGSFWNNELFGMAGFWTQMRGTMRALFLRQFQQFVVTSKRGRQSKSVWPYISAHVYFIAASVLALLWGWGDFLFGLTDDFTKPVLASGWAVFHLSLAVSVVRRSLWPEDRRYNYRHIVHLPVCYTRVKRDAATRLGMTIDLSEGGMALLGYERLPLQTVLDLTITFAGENLRLRGKVVNSAELGAGSGNHRHGVQFDEVHPLQRDAIARLCLHYAVPRLYRAYGKGRQSLLARSLRRARRVLSRRADQRRAYHLPLVLTTPAEPGTERHTVTEEVSRDHLSVLLDRPLPDGAAVEFQMAGPHGVSRGLGRVQRTHPEVYADQPYQRAVIHLGHFEEQDRLNYSSLFEPAARRHQAALCPRKAPLPVPVTRPALRGLVGVAPGVLLVLLTFCLVKKDDFFLRDVVRGAAPLDAGQVARLEQVYAGTLAEARPSMERLVLLTSALVKANKGAEADRVLLALAPLDRNNLDLQIARAQTLTRTRDYAEAETEFRRLLGLSRQGRLRPGQKRELLLAAARSSVHAGKIDAAVPRIREALAAYPTTALRNEFAGALLGGGRHREAAALYETAPADLPGRRLLALAHASAGDFRTAEALCRGILRDRPDDADAELILADVLKGGKQLKQSLEIIRKLQSANPGSPEVRKRLAFLALGGGQYDEALSLFQALLDEGHDKPDVQGGFIDAAATAALDDTQRRTALRLADAFKGSADAPRLGRLAWVLTRLGEKQQSLCLLERAHRLAPGDADVTRQFAGALVVAGRWDEAAGLLGGLPATLDTRRLMVGVHAHKKDLAAAEKGCRSILSEYSSDVAARRQLADILCARKEYPESLRLLQALAAELPGDDALPVRLAEVALAGGNAGEASLRFMALLEKSFDQPRLWRGFLDAAGSAPLTPLHAATAERIATRAAEGALPDAAYLSRLVWVLHRLGPNAPEDRRHAATTQKLLDRAVALKPKVPAARKELAGMLAVAGRFEDARRLYEGLALGLKDRLVLADLHTGAGDYAAAEKQCWEVLQVTPQDPLVLRKLADVLSWQGHYSRSQAVFARLATLNPGDETIPLRVAEVTQWGGDNALAARLFEDLLSRNPHQPAAVRGFLAAVGGLRVLTPGQVRRVKRIHQSSLAGGTIDPALRRDAVYLCRLARALSLAGDEAPAKAVLDRAVALRPEKPDDVQALVDLLAAFGRPHEALALSAKLPAGRRPPLRLAQLLAGVGRFAEAEKWCRAHLRGKPQDRPARRLLADVLCGLGNSKEALPLLESLVVAGEPDAELTLRLAEAALAVGAYEKALDRFGSLPPAVLGRPGVRQGFIAAAAGARELTAAQLDRLVTTAAALAAGPTRGEGRRDDASAVSLARLAWVLWRNGKEGHNDALLSRALALRPVDPKARRELAGVLGAVGRYADAARLYDATPVENDAASLSRVAWVRLQTGQREEALKLLDRALAANPETPEACKELMGVLGAAGRFDDALRLRGRLPAAQQDPLLSAGLLAGAGQWAEAEKGCREALAANPGGVRAGRLLAGVLLATGRAAEARSRLRELVRALPKDAALAEQLALATLTADGPDRALPLYLALPAASQSAFRTQRGFVDAAAAARTLTQAEAALARRVYAETMKDGATEKEKRSQPQFLARLALVLHRTDARANAAKVEKLLALALKKRPGATGQKELVGILSATGRHEQALKLYDELPAEERDRLTLVRLHAGAAQWDRAEEACRALLGEEPGNNKARRLLADVLVGRKDHAKALAVLEQLAEDLPDDPDLPVRLAEVTLWGGAPDRAIARYLALPAGALRRDDVRQGFVAAAAAMRNLTPPQTALARAIHEETMRPASRNAALWSDAPFLARLGLVLYRAGDHAKANALLGRAVALDPADQATRVELAGALSMAEKYAEAVRLYDRLPVERDVQFLSRDAWARHHVGQRVRAGRLLDDAVALGPTDEDVSRELAGVLGAVGKYKQALTFYDRLPLLGDAAYLSRYSWALFQDGQKSKANALLEKALGLKPTEPIVCREVAGVLAAVGRHADALRLYRMLPPGLERQSAEAGVLAASGRHAEAEELGRSLLVQHPRDARVRRVLGGILVGRESTADEGLRIFQELLKEAPGDGRAHEDVADALLRARAFDQAAGRYQSLLEKEFLQPALWVRFVDALAGAKGPTAAQQRLALRIGRAVLEEGAGAELRGEATFLSRLAWVLYRGGEKARAAALAGRAAKAAPEDAGTRRELAGVLAAVGESGLALRLLDGLKLDQAGRLVRIDYLAANKDLAAAEKECRALLEGAPDSEAVKRKLAGVLTWGGKHARALPLLRELSKAHPGDADLEMDVTAALLWSGQHARALEKLAGVLENNGLARFHRFKDGRPRLDLWRCAIDAAAADAGLATAARHAAYKKLLVRLFEKLRGVGADDAGGRVVLGRLAWALRKVKENGKAVLLLTEVVNAAPNDREQRVNLAEALTEMGQYAKAEEHYRLLLKGGR
jgi:tetratricopeptide (TPR) repeat protein/cellulose synthase/poly-beta-1,6-N-acetylglucosamine synthase-like glycosyltransferase